jgi:hypothetical protein
MADREHFDAINRAGEILKAVSKCAFITTRSGDKVNSMAIDGAPWASVEEAGVRRVR